MAISQTSYRHTQRGRLHLTVFVGAAAVAIGAFFLRELPPAMVAMGAAAVLLFVIGFAFVTLTVEDEGDQLLIRYGPLPLFRKRLSYDRITAAHRGHSRWIDGWGIHYVMGRGWTYNLWGFDCVELSLGRKKLRIGTDDADNLTDWIRQRIAGKRQ